jgi:chromosome partitioning protein
MPVIVLCSTKGGVGKSTTALVLAQVYSAAGKATTLIDADPNQPLATWARRSNPNVPENLHVVGGINEETIVDAIDDAAAKNPFVIVDLEGSANLTASYAISRADLVLIPMRGKQLDADQAGRVVALIERESKAFRRRIDYRVVFSMATALLTKEQRHIRTTLEGKGIPILPAALKEMAAFSAMFQIGGTIFDLTKEDVSNPQSAIDNAKALAIAVTNTLKEREHEAA